MDRSLRIYSVLVVSGSQSFNNSIISFFPEMGFSPVTISGSVSEAKRLFLERSFDIVFINAPLPDDVGIEFAKECVSKNCAICYAVGENVYQSVTSHLQPFGIFTLLRPASAKTIVQAISDLCAMKERLRRFEKKVVSAEAKMAEIRLSNRAKWLLIEKKGMDEESAHHYIEKQAMDNQVTKSEISRGIIENLG